MDDRKKVLLIDISGLDYFRMFYSECKKKINADAVTKHGTDIRDSYEYFYKHSEKMKKSKLRSVLRGIEYIVGYIKTLKLIKKNHYDIVHIQWSVIPKVDIFFWKKIKKYTGKLIYTAHDVIPHTPTLKKMNSLKEIYKIPDKIIVHGEFCKKELEEFFPEESHKVYIQKFGAIKKAFGSFENIALEKHQILESVLSDNRIKVFAFIGQISQYKGLDILIKAWERFSEESNLFLLIAGKTIEDYEYLGEYLDISKKYKNVYVYNERFSLDEEKLFYSMSDVIVLPYRTASMSGVLFSAAQYNKTVLSTKVGCLTEYLEKIDEAVFTYVGEENLADSIEYISANYTKAQLRELGKEFSEHIYENYSWTDILDKVIGECYEF